MQKYIKFTKNPHEKRGLVLNFIKCFGLVERLHAGLGNTDDFLVVFVVELHEEVVDRIDPHAVVFDFVVEMGGQRESRIS